MPYNKRNFYKKTKNIVYTDNKTKIYKDFLVPDEDVNPVLQEIFDTDIELTGIIPSAGKNPTISQISVLGSPNQINILIAKLQLKEV